MKRIFYLLFIVISINLEGRTLASNETWSGTHVELDDVIVPNGITLTIDPGTTVKFASGKSLKISGTGQLLAGSLAGATVLFTANDGNWWGHILLENTTSSYLRNCEIEKGDATTLSPNYGGAIHIKTSNVSIEKCNIHNNKATWGGAIFVNQSVSPTIQDCHIYSNTALSSGGAIYFWYQSSPILKNSIIENNTCSNTGATYGGGGIAIYTGTGVAKIINCLIVNNTHSRSSKFGDNIHFNSVNATQFINSIVWGSEYSVYFDATPAVLNFVNSAVQRSYNSGGEILMSTFTNSFKLNASNTGLNPQGPEFKAIDGSDWSLKVISPCRDAGTTPTPTVPNDYAGNSRVSAYDIGAYEVQYNGWKTTATNSTWADDANWDLGEPNSSENVVIRSGASSYPTNSASQSFTIGAGYGLVLDPGAKATFGTLTKTGDLKLRSNSTGISSLITNNSVSAIIELFLTGGGGSNYKWHYISSPVSALPVSTFAPALTLNFAQFIEPRPVLDILQGWVAYDGYLYMGGGAGTPPIITGTDLVVGQGYNYYKSTNYTASFAGTINTADVPKTITFGGNASLHGFNLLGNPFSSGLNWDYIVDPLFPARYPANTSKGLYFTRNNVQCSYIAGVGYPDASVTGVIPPMQGFFIKTTNTSTTLNLPSAARAHNSAARYKGSEIIPLVRVELADDTLRDNTVVRFDTKADAGYDNDFDALRISLNDAETYMYSSVSGVKYSINGQPFPETFTEYPLVVNITTSGNHTLSTSQLQGLDNYGVYLIDKSTGFTADLKTTPVLTFIASPGLISDRFVLKVSNILTATEELKDNKGGFNIYPANNLINIQTISEEWDGKTGSVKVFDLAGKTTSDLQNTEFNRNSLTQVEAPEAKGLYVVEIRSGVKRWVGKVVIR